MAETSMLRAWAILLTGSLAIPTLAVRAADEPVRVEGGRLSGSRGVDASIRIFKGIPFAAPPKGLFHRAIGQSGAQFGPTDVRTRLAAEQAGAQLATAVGATSIADLRAKTAEQILNGGWQGHGTVIDGWVLPESIRAVFDRGHQTDVPLLTGWTANDTGRPTSSSAAEFAAQARKDWGADAESFLKIYPAASEREARQSQIAMMTDRMFGWNAWTWARLHSRTGRSGAYLYHFTHAPPHPDAANQGAFHGSDIYYALGNLGYKKWAWTPADTALASTLSSYWINFAATGNPNGAGLPTWPAYSETADVVMLLAEPVRAKPNPRGAGLEFADALVSSVRRPDRGRLDESTSSTYRAARIEARSP